MTDLHDEDDAIEVYLLFKALHQNSYFPDRHITHHVLLLKSRRDNEFYYTDLDSSNFGFGTIKIIFGPYKFYPQKTIYYQPLGICRKRTIEEIKQFAKQNNLNGQRFSMFKQNCQHYVSSCVEFMELDKSEFLNNNVYWSKDAQDITLKPLPTTQALPLKTLTCLTIMFYIFLRYYLSH